MKKEVFAALCAIALLVVWAPMANATWVTWTLMQDASIAAKGPGPDDLIGTGDDSTTGENNNCNFNGGANCDTSPPPATGSWSFVGLELPQTASCLAGNLGDPCTTNADCGAGGLCLPCPDKAGWDTYSYMGAIPGKALGNGTMKACQELGIFKWTAINIGSSESISQGTGGTCINLRTAPSAASSNCGPGVNFTSLANIKFSLGCNPLLGAGQIDNLQLNGRVYPATGTNTVSNCGYTAGEINTLRAVAAGKGGNYLLVLCGNTAIPNDSTTTSVCLRGAAVWDVVVAYTAANASSCTDPNPGCIEPGPCAGGAGEAAE